MATQSKAELLQLRRPMASGLRRPAMSKSLGLVLDGCGWVVATLAAFWLYGDGAMASTSWSGVFIAVAGMLALKLTAANAFRIHVQSWERFSFRDARDVLLAIVVATTVAIALLLTVGTGLGISVSIPVIDGLLTVVFMFGARGMTRHLNETRLARQVRGRKPVNVLLIGAGEAGSLLVREMQRHPETGMRPAGFIDEDPEKVGRTICSVPVLGRLADLPRVLDTVPVDEVLITIPSADGRTIRSIIDALRTTRPDMPYRTMPALHELLSGRVTVNRIREVTIEDLLRRPPIKLDTESILGYLQGKRVMITGAGGSIGSELVRQICRFGPSELILFGHGENSIYQLERELELHFAGVRYHSVIAAVQNVQRLDYVFRHYRPDVVFHTAAHKHVPLMESNPEEAVFNNIIGTRNLVRLALKYDVSHFVNVSTDKAVNPSSVMGASKRMAELVVEDAARDASDGQTFVSVRFGNVLGSRGSAIPIFQSQIMNGGPVTVTHPEMMRYFMTIPEAASLVLQASALGKNGEIYILDMGEPVRVLDLVKDLIRLSGFEPDIDIPVVFSGIRPGEKLFEELMTSEERKGRTKHEKIFIAKPSIASRQTLDEALGLLLEAALHSDGEAIRRLLCAHIEGSTLTRSTIKVDAPKPRPKTSTSSLRREQSRSAAN